MVLNSSGSLRAAIFQDQRMQPRGWWLQCLGTDEQSYLPRRAPAAKYQWLFTKSRASGNLSKALTAQQNPPLFPAFPYKEQQAPLNSWAIWSLLKPHILKHKTSFFNYYLFFKLIKALELKGEPPKKPFKTNICHGRKIEKAFFFFLGEGQNSPALVSHKQTTFCFQYLIASFKHVPTSQKVTLVTLPDNFSSSLEEMSITHRAFKELNGILLSEFMLCPAP